MNRIKLLLASILLGVAFLAATPSTMACATCFGASDSPMAKGMNWGILSLLVVVGVVLFTIASFFIFLARKSAQVSAATPEHIPLETNNV